MSNWSDALYLKKLIKDVDEEGFEVLVSGSPRKVYANKKSIRSQEFHMAKQTGITLTYMFEVRTNEYKGEEKLMHEGKEHVVYRTYEKGEFLELVCHRDGDNHES